MLKPSLVAAIFVLAPFWAGASEAPLIFRGPGNTQIYADENCKERVTWEQYEIARPTWIDCSVDGNRTTLLISLLPSRSDANWFRYQEAAEIVDQLSVNTQWEAYGQKIKFQGGMSIPWQVPVWYFDTSGVKCEDKLPCGFNGRKVQLIIIGHKTQTVALLAIGDGYVDEIRVSKDGREFVAASQQRFPRVVEAMISTFNFTVFRLRPELLRASICDDQSELECVPQ